MYLYLHLYILTDAGPDGRLSDFQRGQVYSAQMKDPFLRVGAEVESDEDLNYAQSNIPRSL